MTRALARLVAGLGLLCCTHHLECEDGTCVCGAGDRCELDCAAPPCHVECLPDSDCTGECGNGECTCDRDASCTFACHSPPCHVICEGDNPRCDGACANGSCTCGPNSACAFVCDAPPCHASCGAGSSCSLRCPTGANGNCDFTDCAAGEATVCPDGNTTVCDAECP